MSGTIHDLYKTLTTFGMSRYCATVALGQHLYRR
jgi:hypothetical protein